MSASKGKASDFDIDLGKRLRLIRNQKAITQEQLAEEIGVTFQQIQKYEKGTNRISVQRLVHMSKVLDVPCHYLIEHGARSMADNDDPLLPELLRSWGRIKSPGARQAILKFIRSVSKTDMPATTCRKKAGQKRATPARKEAPRRRA